MLVEATTPVIRALPKFETATASHDAKNTSVEIIMKERKTWRSTPDSAAPNPVNGKKPFKANRDRPSNLDKILDRPCQIHGTPDKPATHTNRSCWVFKQAGKLNAEH